MPSNRFRPAKEILWINPAGRRMLLSPCCGQGGSLKACIDHGSVEIRGELCMLISFGTSPGSPGMESVREAIHLTVSISQCQITWENAE